MKKTTQRDAARRERVGRLLRTLKDELGAYLDDRRPPEGFLEAILINDLGGAIAKGRALCRRYATDRTTIDPMVCELMFRTIQVVERVAPPDSYGDRGMITKWLGSTTRPGFGPFRPLLGASGRRRTHES